MKSILRLAIGITCLVASANSALAALLAQLLPPNRAIEVGENAFTIVIDDVDKSEGISSVNLTASMPPMGTMAYMESQADIKKSDKGKYLAELELAMGGTWDLTLSVVVGGKTEKFRYTATTGIVGVIDKNSERETQSQALSLGPTRLQRIGVKMGEVKKEKLTKSIRAVGIVEADPSKRAEVSLRITGYVEKTFNLRVGEQVKAGAPIAQIFSPELVAAQNEFLLGSHLLADKHNNAAGEERLLNLGMNTADIAKLKSSKKPLERITLTSPITGTILEISAREGAKADAGQVLFVIGDLAKSYIIAKVFQSDLRDVRSSSASSFSAPGESQEKIAARVDLIFPTSNDPTGLTDVRLISSSASAVGLKPGQYVDVEFVVDPKEALAIPQEAVLHSGLHTYVFLELQPGTLVATEVVTGKRYGDKIAIVSGLKEGNRIAISGTFLLSSEANLRSALPKWKPTPANSK
jgi:Cu(I)/Ag(I) efflux system membrane fusion protein